MTCGTFPAFQQKLEVVRNPEQIIERGLIAPDYTDQRFLRARDTTISVYLAPGFELQNPHQKIRGVEYANSIKYSMYDAYDKAAQQARDVRIRIGSAAFYELLIRTRFEELGQPSDIDLVHIRSGIRSFNLEAFNAFGYLPSKPESTV